MKLVATHSFMFQHVIDKEDVRQFESFGKFMADRLMEHGELPIGMYRIQQPDQHDVIYDIISS